jgi:hypothetical protein
MIGVKWFPVDRNTHPAAQIAGGNEIEWAPDKQNFSKAKKTRLAKIIIGQDHSKVGGRHLRRSGDAS